MWILTLNTVSDSARLDKTGKTRLGSDTKIVVQNVCMFLNVNCRNFFSTVYSVCDLYNLAGVRTHQITKQPTMGRVVHGASCPWGELSVGRTVRGANCPWGELSVGRIVRGASCPWGELSMGQTVHGANCPWGEMSWGELSKINQKTELHFLRLFLEPA